MRHISLLILALTIFVSTPVLAGSQVLTEAQYSAIQKLGQLNGIALNCGYLAETQRMKKSLVMALPKVRQFGEAFDIETNKAFLKFIEERSICPEEKQLSVEVDTAIIELDAVFAH